MYRTFADLLVQPESVRAQESQPILLVRGTSVAAVLVSRQLQQPAQLRERPSVRLPMQWAERLAVQGWLKTAYTTAFWFHEHTTSSARWLRCGILLATSCGCVTDRHLLCWKGEAQASGWTGSEERRLLRGSPGTCTCAGEGMPDSLMRLLLPRSKQGSSIGLLPSPALRVEGPQDLRGEDNRVSDLNAQTD